MSQNTRVRTGGKNAPAYTPRGRKCAESECRAEAVEVVGWYNRMRLCPYHSARFKGPRNGGKFGCSR